MWRIIVMSIILLHFPFFAHQAIGGPALKINYATVDVENETLWLYGINFTSFGPLDVWIGDTCLTCIPDNCYITPEQIDCGLTGTPALSGGTWTVRISAKKAHHRSVHISDKNAPHRSVHISDRNAPHRNEEIDVYIPTELLAQCNTGDFVECYSGDPATKDVGECKSGIRTCTDGTWGTCEGEIIPQQEVCDDGLDNDCDGLIDLSDSDCCEDNDKDGYGIGPFCLGPDCDDNNADIPGGLCDGPDSDVCLEGIWECDGSTPVCSDTTGDSIEVCNGRDDDCDGYVDEEPAVLCDDGLSCTIDYCYGFCQHDIKQGYCLIDDACYFANQSNPADKCWLCDPDRSIVSWSPRVCEDNDPCTDDSCDPSSGCINAPKDCDDGIACTADFCTNGYCVHEDMCTGYKTYHCGHWPNEYTCNSYYYCSHETGTCVTDNCCF